jgi:hypothetical protein
VLLGEQIEPLGVAGFFACCSLGDDVNKGSHDIHIRLLGCLVKASPHLFAVNGDGWPISSRGGRGNFYPLLRWIA